MVKRFLFRRLTWRTRRLVVEFVRKELKKKRADPDSIRRGLKGLLPRHIFDPIDNAASKRVDSLLAEMPNLIRKQAQLTSSGYDRLFRTASRVSPERQHYLQMLKELRDRVIDDLLLSKLLLEDPKKLGQFEGAAKLLASRFAETPIEHYKGLLIETSTFNAIARRLYPEDAQLDLFHAHHLLDRKDQIFRKFEAAWKLLEWSSTDDFPSMPLMFEGHIRSPKRLGEKFSDLVKIAKEKDIMSFTQDLQRAIDIDKLKTPEQLIAAYKGYYSRKATIAKPWRKAVRALERTESELAKARTRAHLLKELKQKQQ